MRINDRLRPKELVGIMFLLLLHVFVLPTLMLVGQIKWGWRFGGLPDMWINVCYYAVGFVLAFVLAGKYLRRSFDSLLDRPLDALLAVLLTWVIYYGINLAVSAVLMGFDLTLDGNPNQQAVTTLAAGDKSVMIALSVFMTPIVEETIFRGGIFCGLYHKNRILAYAVSMAAFSLYHVWQFALIGGPAMLLFAFQYIPAAFCLCWCYERSGSIWASIAFHMSMNAMAMFLM